MKIPIRLFPNTKLVMTPRLPPPLRVSALRSRLQTSTKAAITIALAALLAACSKTNVEANGAKPTEGPVVAVAQIKTANLSRTLTLTAEFKPYQEVDVMAKVAGYIKEINVDIGDRVSQDQLLAILEIPEMDDDLRRANASVERSQANVKQAQDELARAKSAYDVAQQYYQRLADVSKQRPGLVAQQEIDDANGKALVAQAQVAAANSAVQSAQQQVHVNESDVAKVHTLMDYTRVSAPFTGVVTKRYADKGSMIQAGTASQTQAMPVVRLSQNNLLRLILPVPESAVSTVHIGQQVEVRVPSLNRSFPGQVKRFEDKLSLETRTMSTEVDVENPTLTLMPGMYAEVNLTLARRDHVLVAPVNAVEAGQVAVVTPNHRIEFRKIELGIETANEVEVRSGLNEGDLIVLGGHSGLQSGQEVQPKLTSMSAVSQ
jgi:RND family efflux transporter MFP subunit